MSRLLTDSNFKKEQQLTKIDRESLIKARKEHRRKVKFRSDDTKIEVAKAYLALGGNATLTAHAMNIPLPSIMTWKATSWWKELIAAIRKEEKLELSAKTKNILDKTMEVLADRVVNGDFIYDQKKGELIRKPLSGKDAHKITVDLIDRKMILDKATEEQVEIQGNDDKLAKLAERFAELATKAIQKPKVEVIDVIFAKEE